MITFKLLENSACYSLEFIKLPPNLQFVFKTSLKGYKETRTSKHSNDVIDHIVVGTHVQGEEVAQGWKKLEDMSLIRSGQHCALSF